MKKATSILLAIYFLVGSFTPKMDFQQLLHLACAVEHYALHQSEAIGNGEAFSFSDFLMDHYLDPSNDPYQSESGHQEHPCSHSHNHTVDIAEIDACYPVFRIVENDLIIQIFPFNSSLYSEDYSSGLDEPPSFS